MFYMNSHSHFRQGALAALLVSYYIYIATEIKLKKLELQLQEELFGKKHIILTKCA